MQDSYLNLDTLPCRLIDAATLATGRATKQRSWPSEGQGITRESFAATLSSACSTINAAQMGGLGGAKRHPDTPPNSAGPQPQHGRSFLVGGDENGASGGDDASASADGAAEASAILPWLLSGFHPRLL